MRCSDIKTNIVKLVDNSLSDIHLVEIENHMEHCFPCSNLKKQFKILNRLITNAAPVVPEVDLTKSIMYQIRLQAKKQFRSMFKDVVAAAAAAILLVWFSSPILSDLKEPRYSNEVIKVSSSVGGVFKTYLSLAGTVSDKFSESMKEIVPQVKKGEKELEL